MAMVATGWRCLSAVMLVAVCSVRIEAATIFVGAGGNLQDALNSAQPGDTILLAEGVEFVGNFILPVKAGDGWITVRSAAPDTLLPADGVRIQPAHAPLLPRLRSPNSMAALRTAAGAHHWNIRYVEFAANLNGYNDLIQIGDGSSAQNTLGQVPHHITLNHLYVHGDVRFGQKRCIAVNAAHVTITDSHVTECKGVGQDTQAICGWNGPGPYVIENNHLEAAGEVVMFGGADPAIPNLVADGIIFRRNYLTRPMSWRQPILETPGAVAATAMSGGALPPGTYSYRVVARGSTGQGATGRSTASAEVSTMVSSDDGAVRLQWQPVSGASEYRVYGRTAGAQAIYWTVTSAEFTDTGAAGTAEAVPTSAGTVWTVKNLFELKNARNVLVEGNVLENHWKDAQPGYSIVLTPRNSNGACTWCVVENVRFEYNVVRNVAAGINLLGYDIATRPTRQANNIIVRHNLFQAVTTSLGGNGWFMLIGDEPRDVTIEHNTIESNGSTVVYAYGGTSTDPREIYGFRMIANASKHGSYGVSGATFAYGNAILAAYFPGHAFAANYLAGGSASRYPAGNLFAGVFADQFVNPSGGDFTVRTESALRGAAPDGSDIGVDMAELSRRLAAPARDPDPVPPTAGFTAACSGLSCAFTSTSAAGDRPLQTLAWTFGDGGQALGSEVAHAYAAAGEYTVTLTATDDAGRSASVSNVVTVEAPNQPPIAGLTSACSDLVCTFADASVDADGRVVSVIWNFGDGSGAESASAAHAFAAAGAYPVTVTVVDDDGASASATSTVDVKNLLHGAFVSGATTRWNKQKSASVYYWSADIVVAAHGVNERPIVGATITAAWTGAVAKTASCVTGSNGQCTMKSGTLSMNRSWVSLTLSTIAVAQSEYGAERNHNEVGSGTASTVTLIRP